MIGKAPAKERSGAGVMVARALRLVVFGFAMGLAASLAARPAFALSEIKREELPAPSAPGTEGTEKSVPLPDLMSPDEEDEPIETGPAEPAPAEPDGQQARSRANRTSRCRKFSTISASCRLKCSACACF